MRAHRDRTTAAGAIAVVRAGYGLALLCAPGLLIRLTASPAPASACSVARVLGARHVLQAAAAAGAQRAAPASRVPLACGAGIDLLHALSMIALAAADRRARRTALSDTGIEVAFAVAGALAAAG